MPKVGRTNQLPWEYMLSRDGRVALGDSPWPPSTGRAGPADIRMHEATGSDFRATNRLGLREGHKQITAKDRRSQRIHVAEATVSRDHYLSPEQDGCLQLPSVEVAVTNLASGASLPAQPGVVACVAALSAAVSGSACDAAVKAATFACADRLSPEQVLRAMTTTIGALDCDSGAGEPLKLDVTLPYPWPRAKSTASVILHKAEGLVALTYGKSAGAAVVAGRPTMGELISFAGHPFGGAAVLELMPGHGLTETSVAQDVNGHDRDWQRVCGQYPHVADMVFGGEQISAISEEPSALSGEAGSVVELLTPALRFSAERQLLATLFCYVLNAAYLQKPGIRACLRKSPFTCVVLRAGQWNLKIAGPPLAVSFS